MQYQKQYDLDSRVCELFDENLDEVDWILTLSELELINEAQSELE